MAFTSTDLQNIEKALLELATGARVVRLSIGDRLVEYGQAQLNDLKRLREEVRAETAQVEPTNLEMEETAAMEMPGSSISRLIISSISDAIST